MNIYNTYPQQHTWHWALSRVSRHGITFATVSWLLLLLICSWRALQTLLSTLSKKPVRIPVNAIRSSRGTLLQHLRAPNLCALNTDGVMELPPMQLLPALPSCVSTTNVIGWVMCWLVLERVSFVPMPAIGCCQCGNASSTLTSVTNSVGFVARAKQLSLLRPSTSTTPVLPAFPVLLFFANFDGLGYLRRRPSGVYCLPSEMITRRLFRMIL